MFFDLKGSSKGRYTTFQRSDYGWWLKGKYGHSKIMKDNNFI